MNGLTETVTLRDRHKEVLQAVYSAVVVALDVPISGYAVTLPQTTDTTTLSQLDNLGLLTWEARESGIEVALTSLI